jgi:hypothetical protein
MRMARRFSTAFSGRSLTGKFYGEFASGVQTYAGIGTLRDTW